MKILVTGAKADFRALNIANTMSREKNTAVVAFDDLSLGNPINLAQSVKFVEGSVMDFGLILEASKGCDYIFHFLAGSSSPMFQDDPEGRSRGKCFRIYECDGVCEKEPC